MIDAKMFFDGWEGIVRVLVLGVLGYASLVVLLRASRKRTLTQMSVFDFVVVIVMGELLATTIISGHVPLAEGVAALTMLVGLQALLSWATTRSKRIEHAINGEPALLFHRGRFLRDTMAAERVTESEVLAAAREEGLADLEDVEAVVLETNGEFSVVHVGRPARAPTLRDVPRSREEHPADRASSRHVWREPGAADVTHR